MFTLNNLNLYTIIGANLNNLNNEHNNPKLVTGPLTFLDLPSEDSNISFLPFKLYSWRKELKFNLLLYLNSNAT